MRRYRYVGTVLESPTHGPQLCTFIRSSLPPQASGPDVVGWDWSVVEAESVSGTTWGEYEVVGTFDGERFTVTEPPRAAPPHPRASQPAGPSFTVPCPTPPGGWRPPDPTRATQAALDAAFARASAAPGFAGAWVRDLHGEGVEEGHEPTELVLVVKDAGDLDIRRSSIEEVWGGALCVSPARFSLAELEAIQHELTEFLPRPLFLDIDITANQVEAESFLVTDDLRHEVDDRYGQGAVSLTGRLKPVDA
jgi:hypothetical protein